MGASRLIRRLLLPVAVALALAACTEEASIAPPEETVAETQSPEDEPTETPEVEEPEPEEPPTVRLKNNVGKRLAQVRVALRSVGLSVQIQRRASDRRAGTILAQRPRAGEVRPGRTVTLIVAKPRPQPPPTENCTPGYSPCLPPASDYDCAGGSGDGPAYTGRVTVTGSDPYGLDADGDGVGCE